MADTEFAANGAEKQGAMAWRPIETAPKDGTRVLTATVHGSGYPAVSWWAKLDMIDPEYGAHAWCSTGAHVPWGHQPTHWMPLPAAPGAVTKQSGDQADAIVQAAAWEAALDEIASQLPNLPDEPQVEDIVLAVSRMASELYAIRAQLAASDSVITRGVRHLNRLFGFRSSSPAINAAIERSNGRPPTGKTEARDAA